MAKFRPLVILPPLVFVALTGLFFWGMQRDDPEALPSARIGQAAPPVQLDELVGQSTFDDAALRDGEPKLVNFWASWCAPCRVEHPQLKDLAKEGLDIYGVNYKDDAAKALGFLNELGNPFVAVGADTKGRMGLDWGLYGVPETFVLAGDGTVILRFAGPLTESVMAEKIYPALESARNSVQQ
ncbi:MAG: DsbE family thiol:disulfide interchange protein [Aestuariivita sp.]|nr:DsbE family thiol:disulfide interchange protein [Aestuariivita sp.]MCY4347113.1 DsbE family thiol:disulfide interchange protein [Aestuariivita sp.]